MREFMEHVHGAFYEATGWRRDNSYAALNATSDALLDFATPRGLRLTLSSLATANFASSYQLGSVGSVDGSVAYLFSSVPLRLGLQDAEALPRLLRAYRPLAPLSPPPPASPPPPVSPPPVSLLYGRLYLPRSRLEALAVRRPSPALQLQLSAVSDQRLRDGGTVLGLAQYDVGRYSFEGLASSDGGLLGLRGVYNFGGDADEQQKEQQQQQQQQQHPPPPPLPPERERVYGRFSTGAEIYYGTLNKSGGISLGTRFATLPAHRGTPLTATLTLNPLMGNVAASYAVVAGKHCSLATRLEFNVFSYESAWAVGMELWRRPFRRPVLDDADADEVVAADGVNGDGAGNGKVSGDGIGIGKGSGISTDMDNGIGVGNGIGNGIGTGISTARPLERSWQAKLEWRLDDERDATTTPHPAAAAAVAPESQQPDSADEYGGVLKARLDQNLRIGVLWEGRVKSLLFSLGSGIDLRRLDKPFRTLGMEIQFSS